MHGFAELQSELHGAKPVHNGPMRVVLTVVLLVFVGGCIEPTLRYCDGAACPVSTTCVNGAAGFACVDDSLLAACAGAADATTCSTDDYEGVCRDGICVRPTCGDGFVTVPEACEGDNLDGKTCANVGRYPGVLKCTPACTLDPSECGGSCGDGTRNGPEVCEGSDLGGLDCLDLGFYGGTLGCSDDCTFDTSSCAGTCGDGTINGAEACEGANLDGHTCADVNRYRGDVSCNTVCGINYTECEGYCGDSVVDFQDGEQCDTTPPTTQCISVGFDVGTVGCTGLCQASTATCGKFGWRYLVTLGDAGYVWSDGVETLARIGNNIVIVNGSVTTTHPLGPEVVAVHGSNAGAVVLYMNGSIERYSRATQTWSVIQKPDAYSASGSGGGIAIGDDGTIVVADWMCSVFAYPAGDTEWHVKGGPTDIGCYALLPRSLTDIWASFYHSSNWSASVPLGGVFEFEVLPGATGSALAATAGGAYYVEADGDYSLAIPGNVNNVERAVGRDCASIRDGRVLCRIGDSVREIALPGGGDVARLVDGPDDVLAILVAGEVWTSSSAHWERVQPQVDKPILGVAASQGAVMIQRDDDHVIDLATGTRLTISDAGFVTHGVVPWGDHWVQWTSDAFFEIPRDGSDRIEVAPASFLNVDIWTDGQTFAAVDSERSLFLYDMTQPPPWPWVESVMQWPTDLGSCATPKVVEGRRVSASLTEIFVLLPCVELVSQQTRWVVLRYDGTWTEYYRAATGVLIDDILVPPGDSHLVILTANNVFWMENGAVVLTQPLASPIGTQLAGSSATHLYAFGETSPVLMRWDGTNWTQVRAPLGIDPIEHAAVTDDVIVFASNKIDRLNRFGY